MIMQEGRRESSAPKLKTILKGQDIKMAAKKAAQEKAPVNDKKAALESVMQRIERECGKRLDNEAWGESSA